MRKAFAYYFIFMLLSDIAGLNLNRKLLGCSVERSPLCYGVIVVLALNMIDIDIHISAYIMIVSILNIIFDFCGIWSRHNHWKYSCAFRFHGRISDAYYCKRIDLPLVFPFLSSLRHQHWFNHLSYHVNEFAPRLMWCEIYSVIISWTS